MVFYGLWSDSSEVSGKDTDGHEGSHLVTLAMVGGRDMVDAGWSPREFWKPGLECIW